MLTELILIHLDVHPPQKILVDRRMNKLIVFLKIIKSRKMIEIALGIFSLVSNRTNIIDIKETVLSLFIKLYKESVHHEHV